MTTSAQPAPERPSPMVLNALENACRRYGYTGMNEPAIIEFVRRTANVDHPRFLTRSQAGLVLIELIMVGKFGTSLSELSTAHIADAGEEA